MELLGGNPHPIFAVGGDEELAVRAPAYSPDEGVLTTSERLRDHGFHIPVPADPPDLTRSFRQRSEKNNNKSEKK